MSAPTSLVPAISGRIYLYACSDGRVFDGESGSSEVSAEPVEDALEAIDPPIGSAVDEHHMGLLRVAHHLCGDARHPQRRERDLGMDRRTPQVVLRNEQEQRSLAPRDLEHGAPLVPV